MDNSFNSYNEANLELEWFNISDEDYGNYENDVKRLSIENEYLLENEMEDYTVDMNDEIKFYPVWDENRIKTYEFPDDIRIKYIDIKFKDNVIDYYDYLPLLRNIKFKINYDFDISISIIFFFNRILNQKFYWTFPNILRIPISVFPRYLRITEGTICKIFNLESLYYDKNFEEIILIGYDSGLEIFRSFHLHSSSCGLWNVEELTYGYVLMFRPNLVFIDIKNEYEEYIDNINIKFNDERPIQKICRFRSGSNSILCYSLNPDIRNYQQLKFFINFHMASPPIEKVVRKIQSVYISVGIKRSFSPYAPDLFIC